MGGFSEAAVFFFYMGYASKGGANISKSEAGNVSKCFHKYFHKYIKINLMNEQYGAVVSLFLK